MVQKTNKKKENSSAPIIQQIVIKAPQRRTYDVGQWRSALKAADIGRVKPLYDLFDDMMIDGVLSDAVQKRIDAVTNSEITFQGPKGEEVPELSDLIDTPAFETLLTEIVKCRMYGRSGVELTFDAGGMHSYPILPKYIDMEGRTVLRQDTDFPGTGIPYSNDPHIVILGHPGDFGLLLKAVPYAIYKRGGFGDWSQWIELFGMPQRIGKYNSYDPESRKLLEEAFKTAGAAPWVVVPKEAEIETRETSSGNGESYDQFRKACNEEILITILGQTLTTVQGEKGARSLGEVHKQVEEGKNKSDLRFVQRVLNGHILPLLEVRGYPVHGGKFVFPKAAEQLSVSEVVQLSGIMDIPTSYLHEKYSIPVPQDDEPVAGKRSSGFNDEEDFNSDEADDNENISNSDRSFLARLKDFFSAAPQDGASDGSALIQMKDRTLTGKLTNRIYEGKGKWSPELFKFISDNLLKAVRTPFKQDINNIDITYKASDDVFLTALEQNIFHFSAAKTLAELRELQEALRKSRNYNDFAKRAKVITGKFNNRWQKTEYETALLTAESASNYRRLIKKYNIFPYWKYVTVGDDKVREEHRALDGVILPFNDKRWDKIFPPNGWKCRCYIVPMMKHEVTAEMVEKSRKRVDDYFKTYDWQMAEQQGWGVNRGKRAEIFSANQMYIRKFPGMAAKYMKRIKPSDWGLENSLKKLTTGERPEVVPYTGTADEWWNIKAVEMDGEMVLPVKDRVGRTWYMKRTDYDIHTTNVKKSRDFRTKFLSCIDEILSDPDEVWLSHEYKDEGNPESRLNNWISIRYYNGKALACVCKLEKDRMVFKSWYELMNPKVRSGILIFRK